MEIDRRDLLTGLVATAAAATVPAFAVPLRQGFGGWEALKAGLPARRFYFPLPLFFSLSTPWSLPAFVAHYGGRWRFDPNPKGRPLIQHEDSGLTFRRARQSLDPFMRKRFLLTTRLTAGLARINGQPSGGRRYGLSWTR